MSSAVFNPYQHSGKFEAPGPLLALAAAVVAGFPLGYLYAYLIKWDPFIYVNFLASLGYGFVFGFGSGQILKRFKVRNNGLAWVTGISSGVIALYFAWNGHVHACFDGSPFFLFPGEMFDAMKVLYAQGTWSIHGEAPVSGVLLAMVWVVEGGIIVGFCTLVCHGAVGTTPFCETTQTWLDR